MAYNDNKVVTFRQLKIFEEAFTSDLGIKVNVASIVGATVYYTKISNIGGGI